MTEEKIFKKNEINVMQCVIKTHLSKLKNKLLKYFPPSHDIIFDQTKCGFLTRFYPVKIMNYIY